MAKKQDELPKISASNTKKDILEAYNQLKERLEAEAKEELQPEREKEARRKKEVTGAADSLAAAKVTNTINTLKIEINAALADIAAKMEEETSRYKKVKEAITAREEELEDIFEIEKSAYALAALLEAQKLKKAEFEEKMAGRQAELEEEMKRTKAAWEKEKADYAAKSQEQKEQDKKLRKRDQEEYEYNLKREKELKTNELQDEIKNLEKELVVKREKFEKEAAAREAELKDRQEAVAQGEKELVALQVRVDNFPKEMDDAVKKAVKEVSDRLIAEAEKNEELLSKTFEGEKNVLSTRIQALEQLAAEQKKQLELLSAQLEKAYGKVQDIAVKAVLGPRERQFEMASRSAAQNEDK